MASFLALTLAVLLFGALHSFLASHGVKRWAAGVPFYRLFFVAMSGLTFLPVLVFLYYLPAERLYSITPPWNWLMLALQGGCLLGMTVSVGQTGMVKFLGLDALSAPHPQGAQMSADHLVTSGLYSWVRHPIYTFTLLMLALMPYMTTSWLGLTLGSLIYILAAIPLEERKLVAEFGQAYRDYQKRVPALIPRMGRRG